jgi:TonB-dependent starch-binding outer membrane protein SusC
MEFKIVYPAIRIIGNLTKTYVPMKIIILLTIITSLSVITPSYSQTITLKLNDVSLQRAFKEIKKQTGYSFVYTTEQIEKSIPLRIHVKDASLNEVLDICFTNQPLTFTIDKKYIILKDKRGQTNSPPDKVGIDIKGKIINEQNEPVIAATVAVENSHAGMATDSKGEFGFTDLKATDILDISSVGYEPISIPIQGRSYIVIKLQSSISSLDETIIKGYYATSKRLNTGSVSKVTAEEISRQPVSNPLATLEGLVPGLVVTQTSGVPGGKFNVQIRGRNSLSQGSEPLFIIDGVPFAPNNLSLNQLTSAFASYEGQGLSPFSSLNPNDIESIEVLKDADATAIYGSRGANGVILITTKKGQPGKTTITANVASGFSKVTRTMSMMNTQEYLQVRREAFENDGIAPDTYSAPDLLLWDTTRYTDFKKLFIGGTAHTTSAEVSITGGDLNTQFLIRSDYHYESTVFPGDYQDNTGSVDLNLNHISPDKKFDINLTTNYNSDKNHTATTDPTAFITLPPDLPSLYDSAGKLNWEIDGNSFDNPLAFLYQSYTVQTDNLISNLQLDYKLLKNLRVKISAGYNTLIADEKSASPKAAQNPQNIPSGSASFGINRYKSWIIEPQAEYIKSIGKIKFNALIGGTWQQTLNNRTMIEATGYTNDGLLGSVGGAQNTIVTDGFNQYKYEAVFCRLSSNWQDKYIINFTGRRDGSSRFGPNKRFANFGAVGTAWIFSNENFVKKKLPFISYGKIRASYGTSGNDQIGDYQYLNVWQPIANQYQGPSLIASRLFNPNYSWEVNKKLEAAIEMGIAKDRIILSGAYFRNRSSNQLINYSLPSQTGFTSIIENFPALVQNQGFEFSLLTKNFSGRAFNWTSSFNLSIPRNRLISFPGLATSSYANIYVQGKSLNLFNGYHLSGVDPKSGIYQFQDVDGNGVLNTSDYMSNYNLDPKFYGGLNNSFTYKNYKLNIFLEFKKQMGYNYNNYPIYNFTPGGMYNLPKIMLNRWQKQGDVSAIQQLTQTYSPAFDAQYNFSLSDGRLSDASYIRVKNISLSYSLNGKFWRKMHLSNSSVYILGQNLITVTKYKGSDPETQNLFVLPPLKTITAGFNLTF